MRSPLAACLLTMAVLVACAGGGAAAPEPLPRAAAEDPRAVLSRFVGAVEARRWAEAHALLSARWRQAYTSGRLAADYAGAGPSAREAAGRAAARLEAGIPLRVGEGRAVLPVGPDREAVLVAEDGGWRVDALE